jgi:hypothetical protein
MSISKSSVMRMLLLGAGCAAFAAALALLYRQHLVAGFLLAFGGLSAISLSQTDVDYEERFTARAFASSLKTRHSHISTFGWICHVTSYLSLAAALISWVALR